MMVQQTEAELDIEAEQYSVSGEACKAMEHKEAIEMMASERYLLDKLAPELRDAYEEHFFGCAECAQDVQLGAKFIDHAKVLLPGMVEAQAAPEQASAWHKAKPIKQTRDWFAWLRPAIMAPTFALMSASLMAVVGYQNLVVYPALQATATGPRILPPATLLHDDTRSGVPAVYADLRLGSTIAVEMPSGASFSSFKLECYNSHGAMIWTRTVPGEAKGDDTLSFWLSGSVKLDTYKLIVSGITPSGQVIPVKQQIFDLQMKK